MTSKVMMVRSLLLGRKVRHFNIDYGYRKSYFVDIKKDMRVRRGHYLGNGFTVYYVRNYDGTWDAIEEESGMSVKSCATVMTTKKHIVDYVETCKDIIFDKIIEKEDTEEVIQLEKELEEFKKSIGGIL